jgi:transposase
VTAIICGVDVASKKLDARIGPEGPFATFDNNPEGVSALAAFCRKNGALLVVMEATGGYERQAFAQLWGLGLQAAIVNPRNVRDFAKAMGWLEKTDKIDAGAIAWYGEVRKVKPTPPARSTQQRLTALVMRLGQLTNLRTAQNQQRRGVTDACVLATISAILAVTARQIRAVETEIAQEIAADPLWKTLDATFRSLKGVADRTVARLMARLPEIGLLSGKAITKLVGLAPIARDSGNSKGRRPIRGGREDVRTTLFVVAGLVAKFDADMAKFRDRLLAAGKPKMVVRIALAHKLLVRLNAKAREARDEYARKVAALVA